MNIGKCSENSKRHGYGTRVDATSSLRYYLPQHRALPRSTSCVQRRTLWPRRFTMKVVGGCFRDRRFPTCSTLAPTTRWEENSGSQSSKKDCRPAPSTKSSGWNSMAREARFASGRARVRGISTSASAGATSKLSPSNTFPSRNFGCVRGNFYTTALLNRDSRGKKFC